MALSTNTLHSKRFSWYNQIEDFTFSMPGGWDDYTIRVFLEACHTYVSDLKNNNNDFMRQWSRIVSHGLEKTSNTNCFNITVTMELAKVLKAYILKNEKLEKYVNNPAFIHLMKYTKDLIQYFPNANDSQIPALQLQQNDCSGPDKEEPASVIEVINIVSKQYQHLFGAKGIPTSIVWSEMSQKVSEKTGIKIDVKLYLEPIKIKVALEVRKETNNDEKIKKFLSLAKDFLAYFDFIPPRSIKKSEFLPPNILADTENESEEFKDIDPESNNDTTHINYDDFCFNEDDFMEVENIGAFCEIPYCEELKNSNLSSEEDSDDDSCSEANMDSVSVDFASGNADESGICGEMLDDKPDDKPTENMGLCPTLIDTDVSVIVEENIPMPIMDHSFGHSTNTSDYLEFQNEDPVSNQNFNEEATFCSEVIDSLQDGENVILQKVETEILEQSNTAQNYLLPDESLFEENILTQESLPGTSYAYSKNDYFQLPIVTADCVSVGKSNTEDYMTNSMASEIAPSVSSTNSTEALYTLPMTSNSQLPPVNENELTSYNIYTDCYSPKINENIESNIIDSLNELYNKSLPCEEQSSEHCSGIKNTPLNFQNRISGEIGFLESSDYNENIKYNRLPEVYPCGVDLDIDKNKGSVGDDISNEENDDSYKLDKLDESLERLMEKSCTTSPLTVSDSVQKDLIEDLRSTTLDKESFFKRAIPDESENTDIDFEILEKTHSKRGTEVTDLLQTAANECIGTNNTDSPTEPEPNIRLQENFSETISSDGSALNECGRLTTTNEEICGSPSKELQTSKEASGKDVSCMDQSLKVNLKVDEYNLNSVEFSLNRGDVDSPPEEFKLNHGESNSDNAELNPNTAECDLKDKDLNVNVSESHLDTGHSMGNHKHGENETNPLNEVYNNSLVINLNEKCTNKEKDPRDKDLQELAISSEEGRVNEDIKTTDTLISSTEQPCSIDESNPCDKSSSIGRMEVYNTESPQNLILKENEDSSPKDPFNIKGDDGIDESNSQNSRQLSAKAGVDEEHMSSPNDISIRDKIGEEVVREDKDRHEVPMENEEDGQVAREDIDGHKIAKEDEVGLNVFREDEDGQEVIIIEDREEVVREGEDKLEVSREDISDREIFSEGLDVQESVREDKDGPEVVREDKDGPEVVREDKDGLEVVREDKDGPEVVREDEDGPEVVREDKDGPEVVREDKDGPEVVREDEVCNCFEVGQDIVGEDDEWQDVVCRNEDPQIADENSIELEVATEGEQVTNDSPRNDDDLDEEELLEAIAEGTYTNEVVEGIYRRLDEVFRGYIIDAHFIELVSEILDRLVAESQASNDDFIEGELRRHDEVAESQTSNDDFIEGDLRRQNEVAECQASNDDFIDGDLIRQDGVAESQTSNDDFIEGDLRRQNEVAESQASNDDFIEGDLRRQDKVAKSQTSNVPKKRKNPLKRKLKIMKKRRADLLRKKYQKSLQSDTSIYQEEIREDILRESPDLYEGQLDYQEPSPVDLQETVSDKETTSLLQLNENNSTRIQTVSNSKRKSSNEEYTPPKKKKKLFCYEVGEYSTEDSEETPFRGFSNNDITLSYRNKLRHKPINFERSDNYGPVIINDEVVVLKKAKVVVRDFVQELVRTLETDPKLHVCSCDCLKLMQNANKIRNDTSFNTTGEATRSADNNVNDNFRANSESVGTEIKNGSNNKSEYPLELNNKTTQISNEYFCKLKLTAETVKIIQEYQKDELSPSKTLRDLMDSDPQSDYEFGFVSGYPVSETCRKKLNSYSWFKKFINEYSQHLNWKTQLKWKMKKEVHEIEKHKQDIMEKVCGLLVPQLRST